jgi:hypothetical protein
MTRVRAAGESGARVEQLVAGDAEQVADRNGDPVGGQQRVDLLTQAGAQVDELGAVAHELAQITGGRWRDPTLGQAVHAQLEQVADER